ncbi:MAG: phage tail sheath subtilisin-like domain-containing protein [Bryobacteraceae bacterium]|nr:phage tail sheath subtilisin-like domain-containing protein [Bryobacteraceae bacterium]
MPEYLAPGVYVEETSFRAKSIEGVGTSTTGFAGPTRKGPAGDTPELITSFGDFERIYGGFDELNLPSRLNYLAHAVNAYFNNGGTRLYISRVFLGRSPTDTGLSGSADVNGSPDATRRAFFRARTPGSAGNGQIFLRQADAPATVRSMGGAPEGSLLRLGGDRVAAGAQLAGAAPPFRVPNDRALLLTVNGTDAAVTFHGEPAEATGAPVAAFPVVIDNTNNTLNVVIDGLAQTVTLANGNLQLQDLDDAVNRSVRGGFARFTPDNRLVIGSDRRGRLASVTVRTNAALGFAADTTVLGTATAANNVGDLGAVTADEINVLLGPLNARAALNPRTGMLVLSTVATGTGATIAIRDGASSAHSILGLTAPSQAAGAAGSTNTFHVKRGNNWLDSGGVPLNLGGLQPGQAPGPDGIAEILTINVVTADADGHSISYEDIGFDPLHPRYLGAVLAPNPARRADQLENMFGFTAGAAMTALDLRTGLFGGSKERLVTLTGGNDGAEPIQSTYEAALAQLEKLEDIAIVAAPGHSAYADFQGIQGALISHAEKRRSYRIAVLDTRPDQTVSGMRADRSRIDSAYAALYGPWVVVSNPLFRPGQDNIPKEITLPPSGFVSGIYARNDVERGVFKAPANEIVRGALRFETDINFAQQEVLNPLGVNCLRYLSGRGYRVWGARTATSDPEWKYVNVRRYFNYLEASIDRGTQWAVFEPNGPALWANIRETISAFLYNEWLSGALLGATQQEAFFVRCDRSTMTQNNLDNGQLICLIGVAVVKPAEFVIFRIGQKTADTRS